MITASLIKPLISKLIKNLRGKNVKRAAFEFDLQSGDGLDISRVYITDMSGAITPMTMEEFETFVKDERKLKPNNL